MDAATSRRVGPGSWFICPRPNPDARARLFCLPFGGGGASVYHGWPQVLRREAEVRAVQLPGRESRMREPRITDALVLARAIADAIDPYLDRPFALFGYSMGALLAFETARELRRRARPLPAHLFVAAMHAPQLPQTVPPLARLPEADLLRAVREYYQPPEEALQVPELRELFLPVLRDDMALVDGYVYQAEPPLSCAIDAHVGASDRSVSVAATERWRDQTSAEFVLTVHAGGHFFIRDALPALQARVTERLRDMIGARP